MDDRRRGRGDGTRPRRRFLRAAVGTIAVSGCLRRRIEKAADRRDETESPTATAGRSERVTVAVGPEGTFGFVPGTDSPLRIDADTTVVFVWKTNSHNIVVEKQPDGADWRGTPDGREEAYDEGYRHEHTFTVPGTYRFHCAPHETVGATGTIEVVAPSTEAG
ncbi:Plastocyanin [Halopelagius inordinatus]|uniref:Plastocyanin n=1 Tax=Halopelagius inordinatus TaxID=553467 RepID=A0A1I2VVJ6_9EURY|nr:plastocyanin/azurin family copper-binding protein [Halopelagius inordinatus]SFG91686.1 Plastocyanin [Halopelagius inordinatus]